MPISGIIRCRRLIREHILMKNDMSRDKKRSIMEV